MLSFWEKNSFLTCDYIIIGSGLMGLHIAYELISSKPDAKIIILERGILPAGASTKNAGFACFGSLSEILEDINLNGVDQTIQIVKERYEGILLLCERLGKAGIGFQQNGGYELIFDENKFLLEKIAEVNSLLYPLFNQNVFVEKPELVEQFGFNSSVVKSIIFNQFEGQIDTGLMMKEFIKLLNRKGVQILTGAEVISIDNQDSKASVEVLSSLPNQNLKFNANKIFVCTNALIGKVVKEEIVKPGRGQVLITKPIASLPFKGVFHFDKGFFYFRNYNDRVIFGGGRNLDFKSEESFNFEFNDEIQNHLEKTLRNIILPKYEVEIEQRWTGIMGFSSDKKPIIKKHGNDIILAMSCNGMGVALSGISAKKAVGLID